ncbi:NAD(P)H-binding protein [Streptomyces pseudogriseolus]|uniref:NAD(P)H-binding protein n=1 Tax=Streptomyces pseudogriseolus TaxID=36817 RepID=UPI003FA1F669
MIVITTPTGRIGRQVLDHVLDATDGTTPVRVIARDPSRLTPRARERTEIFQGSHADPDLLGAACAGADRVFWLVPPAPGADGVEDHFRDFTLPLCEVIGRGEGVERVVAVSTAGRGVAKNAGQVSASLAMDDRIAATGVHYRAVCPPFLMENLLGQAATLRSGEFSMPLTVDRVLRTCATADIAATAARLLLDTSWTGRADVPVIGPDDLTPEGMAQVLSEVLDRTVRVRQITPEDYRAAALRSGASEAMAQGLADMAGAMDDQGFYGPMEPSTPDTAPTGFREWCETVLRPTLLS